jgi:hypothetical protein
VFFGRKIEVSGISTIGGEKIERSEGGMPYGPFGCPPEPYIRVDPEVTSEPLGVMTSRCIDGGGGPALAAWQSQADAARERSWRRSTIDEQLEQLGNSHERAAAAAANPRVRHAALIVGGTRAAAPD